MNLIVAQTTKKVRIASCIKSSVSMTELLERRSRPPSRLYSPHPHVPKHPLTPSPIHFFSSTPRLEISEVQFTAQETRKESHTERLTLKDCDVLLRRGNTLILKISTTVEFTSGYSVSLTFVPIFRPRDRFGQFRARGVSRASKEIWLSITIPPNFPVGKYHGHIALSLQGGTEILTHFHHKSIVVLFNPWNPEDDTYMEESGLHDNLLSEVGTIWRGTWRQMRPLKWEFGQSQEHCLDVALFLLRFLDASECRSAATVSRGIVSQVNPRDNSGVLVGCFSGSYGGGTHPCRWNGSPAILQKFYRSKMPVRYGQCWVFAGVVVTLLRALGVPCRPVTCYEAAHFCLRLGQADRCFSTEGDPVHDASPDQIWVYHVWCEAWMRRDDLPSGYEGWQVLDATSQDKQSGRHCVGPASVKAVREKQTGREWSYGSEYVVSEVGADVRYLRISKSFATVTNRTLSMAQVRRNEVGVRIVTTTTSSSHTPVDITSNYRDTTEEDTETTKTRPTNFPPPARDCSFKVSTSDAAKLGEDISLSVGIKNEGPMLRTVDGRVVGHVVHYSGRPVRSFMSMQFTGVVSPGQSATVSLPIESKKYLRLLTEQSLLQFFVAVKVRESRQLFLKVHNFQLEIPSLEVQCLPSPRVAQGGVVRVRLRVRNTLHCSLSRVLFLVQAQDLQPQRELSHKRLVLPGGVISVEFPIRAHHVGHYTLLASMHCDQLTDVRGWAELEVTEKPT